VPPGLRELPGQPGWLAACHLNDPAYGAPGLPAPELTEEMVTHERA
jgi:hypothetical protein